MNMAEVAQQTVKTVNDTGLIEDWKSFGFTIGLFFTLALLAGALIHQSRLPKAKSRIDLDDLLLDHRTNRLSDRKVGKMVSLVVSSWVIIFMTSKLALTEWALLIYMGAWVAEDLTIAAKGKLATPAPPVEAPPEKLDEAH